MSTNAPNRPGMFSGLFGPSSGNAGGSPGIVQQILMALAFVLIIYFTFMFIELIYKYVNRLSINRVELLPYTCNMDSKAINIPQNPNRKGSKPVSFSDNERTGVEFSYSFYLNINPSAFRQEYGLMHMFHKGFSSQFPLLAPGVYMRSDTNTMRVYMNTYKTWNNYVEVENIPVGKWVHIVLACKAHSLEIYVNGNLSRKMSFDGYAPYQNYQDICCFSQRRITLKHANIPSVDENGLDVFGAMKGMLSRLNYFSYALCYAEIQKLMNEGPSSKMDDSALSEVPPYLADTWWAKSY
jgi:hypothetical protein